MWYNAVSVNQNEFERCWLPGDIIGSLLGIFYHFLKFRLLYYMVKIKRQTLVTVM